MPEPSGHILRFTCASVCWFLPKKTNMPPKGHQYSMPLETVFWAIYQLTDTLVLISVSCKMLNVTSPWEIECSRKLVDFTFQRDKTMAGHSHQGAIWMTSMDFRTHPSQVQPFHYNSSAGYQGQCEGKASASTPWVQKRPLCVERGQLKVNLPCSTQKLRWPTFLR